MKRGISLDGSLAAKTEQVRAGGFKRQETKPFTLDGSFDPDELSSIFGIPVVRSAYVPEGQVFMMEGCAVVGVKDLMPFLQKKGNSFG